MDGLNQLPISGGFILAALGIGAAGVLLFGPLVGERTIERSGWQTECEISLAEEIQQDAPAPVIAPKLGCDLFMGFFGKEGRAYCDMHGGIFENPLFDSVNQVQQQTQQLNRKRLEHAVAGAADRCKCASNLMLEENRFFNGWAGYALSGRLITPQPIKNLHSELETALRSPLCSMKG